MNFPYHPYRNYSVGQAGICVYQIRPDRILCLLITLSMVIYILSGCQNNSTMQNITPHAFRLKPGQDLKTGIQQIVAENQIKAGWISTGAGSLTNYNIRFANQPNDSADSGHF